MLKHRNSRYEDGLDVLKKKLLDMGALVRRQICQAVEAFASHNSQNARTIVFPDCEVDRLDSDLESIARTYWR
jgi:phosphate uptake regulator